MKKAILILAIILMANGSYCQNASKTSTKTYDPKLVGCWRGEENGQQRTGTRKYWVSCRFADGTSTLLFIAIDENCETNQTTENGKWWVENGKYYELHNYDGVVDIYNYQAIGDDIKFTAVEVMGDKNSSYTFVDYRIAEDKK
jgi:hypothetical protein